MMFQDIFVHCFIMSLYFCVSIKSKERRKQNNFKIELFSENLRTWCLGRKNSTTVYTLVKREGRTSTTSLIWFVYHIKGTTLGKIWRFDTLLQFGVLHRICAFIACLFKEKKRGKGIFGTQTTTKLK